jgi:hypothetical protein
MQAHGSSLARVGISSYSAKRNTLEGDKHFAQVPADASKREADVVFAEGDVYNIEILVSSGAGKPRQQEARTTVYRRTDTTYQLKLKASRAVFSEIQSSFGAFAFTLRYGTPSCPRPCVFMGAFVCIVAVLCAQQDITSLATASALSACLAACMCMCVCVHVSTVCK